MEHLFERKPLLITLAAVVIVLAMILLWGRLPASRSGAAALPIDELAPAPVEIPKSHYIEIIDGCGPYFEGPCVNIRSGPGTSHPVVEKLRIGAVLKVEESPVPGEDGNLFWHKVIFDAGLRYPERVSGDWYVVADPTSVRTLEDRGDEDLMPDTTITTKKRILVDRSEQMLYAYDGDALFMQEPISTGLDLNPTPRGTFNVYRKTPSRYMQGPLPGISDQYYDLPGVPWNLYFTYEGAVIHGAYWHDHFGEQWSHGCVNLPPHKAKELYGWADLGTEILVRD